MALAAIFAVIIALIAYDALPTTSRGFADAAICIVFGILVQTVCGIITWATARSDKYLELSLTQVVYTSFLPLAIFCLYVLYTIITGDDSLAPLFMALFLAWIMFVLPSGIAVILCTGLYKIAAKRYAE